MAWVIAETQKDVQRFWDAFNAELQNKLEEVTRLKKKVEEVHAKLREEAGKVEAKPISRFTPGVFEGLSILASTLWESAPGDMLTITKGVAKLPRKMYEGLIEKSGAAAVLRGFLFGAGAVAVVIAKAKLIVFEDVWKAIESSVLLGAVTKLAKSVKVGSKLYKFARPIAKQTNTTQNVMVVGEMVWSRHQVDEAIKNNLVEAKRIAEDINSKILKVQKCVDGWK